MRQLLINSFHCFALCCCFVAALGVQGQGEKWESFRGGAAMTGVAGCTLPSAPRQLWSYETGSAVTATAAIVEKTVYLCTQAGIVLALNLETGKVRWKFSGGAPISASPCVVNNALYVGDESGKFFALNSATGKVLWSHHTGDKIMSSATSATGVVLVGSYDNNLYCFQAGTGKVKWMFKADAQVHCAPCVADGKVIIAGCDGLVRMINLTNGRQVAAATLQNTNFAASPAYAEGCVFVGSLTGEYLAIRTKDGQIQWRINGAESYGDCYAGAALAGDAVIFATRGKKLLCVTRDTGRVVWEYTARSSIDSSPVLAGMVIFVGSDDGLLLGVRLDNGKVAWHFNAGAALKASPAIAQGKLVIGTSDGAIYCFGR